MTEWQDSHSINKRHEHTPITDEKGQDVCSSCHQIVIKPITSSDDPRLEQAGFMRSAHHEKHVLHGPMPLPEILIELHNESQGEFPAAPYLINIIKELDRRGELYEGMWIALARKTQS